ncbi:hypothetical protein QJS10_CPA03g00824 [Acorus calamus]|uniref:Uncharacterized protein n=1 Tax=Acorus calamus TaxID=4465 RepID=A0AAV9FBH6_ACOCL|nr:hypothetical protein QJS10_CPA03g00824 [Acorus calamus]
MGPRKPGPFSDPSHEPDISRNFSSSPRTPSQPSIPCFPSSALAACLMVGRVIGSSHAHRRPNFSTLTAASSSYLPIRLIRGSTPIPYPHPPSTRKPTRSTAEIHPP